MSSWSYFQIKLFRLLHFSGLIETISLKLLFVLGLFPTSATKTSEMAKVAHGTVQLTFVSEPITGSTSGRTGSLEQTSQSLSADPPAFLQSRVLYLYFQIAI